MHGGWFRSAGLAACASLASGSGCYWNETEQLEPIVPRTESTAPSVPLGLNLGSLNYYSPTLPFVDVMKNADEPKTTGEGGNPWDTDLMERVPRDEAGYPLELPYTGPGIETPQWVRYSVVSLIYGGRYTLLYDGDGDFEFPTVPATVVSRAPGVVQFEVPQRDGSLFMTLTRSQKNDHVRNLRLLLPGFSPDGAHRFHPRFLERVRGASVLRFMDWQRTNNSELSAWSDRATPEDSQATWRGAALETMLDLAQAVNADPWFCVPHLADDAFIEQMATVVRDRLGPERVVYIEYSNELWNGIFTQAKWVEEQGCKEAKTTGGTCATDVGRMWAGVRWSARRAARVFEIFEGVLGGTDRLVRVLGGQAAGAGRNEALLESFNDRTVNTSGVRADALAIAPYFASGVSALAERKPTAALTVDDVVAWAEGTIKSQVRDATRENKRLADYFGLRLIGYEGGQHLVVGGAQSNDEALATLLIEANRDPRMAALYEKMFDAWYAESGGELLVLFNSAERPGKHGAWGLLESQEQPDDHAPKYRAFVARLAELATD